MDDDFFYLGAVKDGMLHVNKVSQLYMNNMFNLVQHLCKLE